MPTGQSKDAVTVTTTVALDPDAAFRLFTDDVDTWWQRGPRYRFRLGEEGVMRFEPGVGGRFLEVFDQTAGDVYEVGRVLVWEPGDRLVFEFRPRDFGPGDATEVDVRFQRTPQGTLITLEHRGWDGIAPDHPVRHGMRGSAFQDMMGVWWADLFHALQNHARKG